MKKLISIILSLSIIMCMTVNISALTPKQRGALSGGYPILDSDSIQGFEKTLSDFFKKYPKKELAEYKAQKDGYDFMANLKSLYLPKKFKDKPENIVSVSIMDSAGSAVNGAGATLIIYEENGIDYWYSWGSANTEKMYIPPELQVKYVASSIVNGITVNQKQFFSDKLSNHIYDRNGYKWTLPDGSTMSLTVYGPEGDYFDYCDMYEYKLNLAPKDISAGEGAYQDSTPLNL